MPSRKHWNSNQLAMLGQVPDDQVARLVGVHVSTVRQERRRRGIPSFQPKPRVVWTEETLKKLGTVSDADLAAEVGCKATAVFKKRQELGIPPCFEPVRSWQRRPWRKCEVDRLGKASDADVAKDLGRSLYSVVKKRREQEIGPFKPPPVAIEWTSEMLADLGVMGDPEFSVRHGVSRRAALEKREELGIPSWKTVHNWTESDLAILREGGSPEEIAQRVGTTVVAVRNQRSIRGLAKPQRRDFVDEPENGEADCD